MCFDCCTRPRKHRSRYSILRTHSHLKKYKHVLTSQQIPDRIRTDLKIDTPRKKKTVSDLTFTFRLDRGSHSENLCIPRAGLIDGDRSHAQFRMHTRRRPKVIFSAALGRYRAPRIRKKARLHNPKRARTHVQTSAENFRRGERSWRGKPLRETGRSKIANFSHSSERRV